MKKSVLVVALFILLAMGVTAASAQDSGIVVTTIRNYDGLVEYGPISGWIDISLVDQDANALIFWITEDSNAFLYGVEEPVTMISSFDNKFLEDTGLDQGEYLGMKWFADPGTRMVLIIDSDLPAKRTIRVDHNFDLIMPPAAAFEEYPFLCEQFPDQSACQQ